MNAAMMNKIRKMQKDLQEAQQKLQETVFVGKAGGVCEIEMKGTHEVLKVTIDKDAFETKDDIEMIEDALVSAYNDALKQIEDATAKMMGPYASMLGGVL